MGLLEEIFPEQIAAKPWRRDEVAAIIFRFSNDSFQLKLPEVAGIDRKSVSDIALALRKEFADELARLGPYNMRETDLEARVVKPPKLLIAPSIPLRSYRGYWDYDPNLKNRTFLELEKNENPAK